MLTKKEPVTPPSTIQQSVLSIICALIAAPFIFLNQINAQDNVELVQELVIGELYDGGRAFDVQTDPSCNYIVARIAPVIFNDPDKFVLYKKQGSEFREVAEFKSDESMQSYRRLVLSDNAETIIIETRPSDRDLVGSGKVYKKATIGDKETWTFVSRFDIDNRLVGIVGSKQELGSISPNGEYVSVHETNFGRSNLPALYHFGKRSGDEFSFAGTINTNQETGTVFTYFSAFFEDQVAVPSFINGQRKILLYNLSTGEVDQVLNDVSEGGGLRSLSHNKTHILTWETLDLPGSSRGRMFLFEKNGLKWTLEYISDFVPNISRLGQNSIIYSKKGVPGDVQSIEDLFILEKSETGWDAVTELDKPKLSNPWIVDVCEDLIINFRHANAITLAPQAIEVYQLAGAPPKLEVYDANPDFIGTGFLGLGSINHITDLSSSEDILSASKVEREAFTADGVSEGLLVLPFDKKVTISSWQIDSKYGRFEFPWSASTSEANDKFYFFIHYFPPDEFPEDLTTFKINGVDAVNVPFTLTTITEEGDKQINLQLTLVRPPVVLVHGTFDNPDNCWETPISPSANTMVQGLEQQGFKVFTVDYEGSNGHEDGVFGSGFGNDLMASSFESNKQMVYENQGGVKDAVEYYRDEMNVATTQVDVIGHSMGGVLPRVYYSEGYSTNYKRINNFNEGDINRHISIASTHHGSEIVDLLQHVEDINSSFEIPLFEAITSEALVAGIWFFGGVGNFGAVTDQKPQSKALQKIGQTSVPAHAILCSFPDQINAISNAGDPAVVGTYANIMRALTFVFYFKNATTREWISNLIDRHNRLPQNLQNQLGGAKYTSLSSAKIREARKPSKRQAFIDMFEFGLNRVWFAFHFLMDDIQSDWIDDSRDIYVTPYETTEIGFNDPDDDLQVQIAQGEWDLIEGEKPISGATSNQSDMDKVVDLYRSLIFKNDLNDGVVRVESQKGGLSDRYTSHFPDVLHSYAPRYPEIINRVSTILKSGMENFDEDGFGPAGQLQPINIPDPREVSLSNSLSQEPEREGLDAICWSGYVCSHALEYARFADKTNTIILGRPVNPDATAVLFDDNAAKGMNIKGKSSNWGPQRALIAEDQKYSKIWFQYEADNIKERDEQIEKYSGEVVNSLNNPGNIAVLRQLKKRYKCDNSEEEYDVFFDTTVTDAVQSIFFKNGQGQYFNWLKDVDDICKDKVDCCPISATNPIVSKLRPLNVLADPRSTDDHGKPLFYTADYDLLAIGFHQLPLDGSKDDDYPAQIPQFTPDDFDPDKGFITKRQDQFVDLLNEEVIERAQFKGGNLTHHGPENQYYIAGKPKKGSPYVDYPIIAFEPDSDRRGEPKGNIRAIPMGPEGFRDRYLKQYMAKMRRRGYDLYPNIVTNGWKWDHYHPYSYELGWDDRDWPALPHYVDELPFPDDCICQMKSNEAEAHQPVEYKIRDEPQRSPSVFPNPATTTLISSFKSKVTGAAQYNIIDMTGRIVISEQHQLIDGTNQIKMDISFINAGIYVLMIQLPNGAYKSAKFLKETLN